MTTTTARAESARTGLRRDDTVRLAVGALAVWRLTHLIAHEDGPGDLVVAARLRAGDGLVGQAMDCFHCLSVWIAAGVAPLVVRRRRDLPLAVLALSGAACLLQRLGSAPTAHHTAESHIDEGDDHGLLRLQA